MFKDFLKSRILPTRPHLLADCLLNQGKSKCSQQNNYFTADTYYFEKLEKKWIFSISYLYPIYVARVCSWYIPKLHRPER